MARLYNSGPTLIRQFDTEYEEIKTWYRTRLEAATPHFSQGFEPKRIGPTWQWDAVRGWELPELSIGWDMLAWAGLWLQGDGGAPWVYTMEQARFLLWYGAVNPTLPRKPDAVAQFIYNEFVLQRMKGWGKDPLAATIGATAMVGPSVPYWDKNGELCSRDEPEAWVQTMAVSQEQTKNTMMLFPGLISPAAMKRYGFQIGKLNVWALGDTRRFEAITSNPFSVEGGRPTLVIPNETQNWTDTNQGHQMIGALKGNVAKAKKTRPARRIDLCNAYQPHLDSVAQRVREGWEQTIGDEATRREWGLMYDSLEAPEESPLTVEYAPTVVKNIRGDSIWLSSERIVKSVLDPTNPPSESRRKWYNQIVAAEDAWLSPSEVDAIIDTEALLDPRDEVMVFFDASKSDDATAVSGCRVSDGWAFTIGLWQRPPGKRGTEWLVPRETVDHTVRVFLDTHNVIGLWADPSHAKDDETLESYWEPVLDGWHRDYRRQLRLWAQTGKNGHAVIFDMSESANLRRFVSQVGFTTNQILNEEISFDGDARMRQHLLNARRMPTRHGMSLSKPHRMSRKKIDLAITMVGAQLMRREYLNTRTRKRGGKLL